MTQVLQLISILAAFVALGVYALWKDRSEHFRSHPRQRSLFPKKQIDETEQAVFHR